MDIAKHIKRHTEKKVKGCSIVFDPSIKEFSVILGERFFFNFHTQQFELDTNPFGDPKCVPIFDLVELKNGIQFATQNIEMQPIVITSSHPLDLCIMREMLLLHQQGFLFNESNSTKIEILVEKGKFKTIRLIKIEDYSSKDFLTLLFEEGQSFVIKYPFQKLPLNKAYMDGNNMVSESPEETITWQVLLPDSAVHLIRQVFAVELAK
ncbi:MULTISPECIES: hypothetical protein [Sphingobacterium]|uniref:hypothetical protein n=1 Tax=Sphingobacterium TaxID=28453 RepID=UPI0028A699C2|nr:hypothetical protein [Sphingobacterium multivorum]